MADSAESDELFWLDPEWRGILPLDGLHVSRRLARTFAGGGFEIRVDHDFGAVVRACAERPETWINADILRLYEDLHRMGRAHSVEIWQDGALAGGLYGVTLGAAFFGESMFSRRRDGSKLALVALVARLRAGGFRLLDTQFVTPHLATLGGIEVGRDVYHRLLAAALPRQANFRALPVGTARAAMLELAVARAG